VKDGTAEVRMNKRTVTLFSTILLGAGTAFAAAPVEVPPEFESLDRDRNGLLSDEEVSAGSRFSSRFGSLDRNDDGSLDLDEFSGVTPNERATVQGVPAQGSPMSRPAVPQRHPAPGAAETERSSGTGDTERSPGAAETERDS
jgi:hypothetical protein